MYAAGAAVVVLIVAIALWMLDAIKRPPSSERLDGGQQPPIVRNDCSDVMAALRASRAAGQPASRETRERVFQCLGRQ